MAKAQVATRIYSRFSTPDSAPVEFGVSMTQQHFKDECDINNIVKTYVPPADAGSASFGDFTVTDLQDAYDRIDSINQQFATLPADVRAKFNHNPLEAVAFVEGSDDLTAAFELGLIPAPEPAPEPASTSVSESTTE